MFLNDSHVCSLVKSFQRNEKTGVTESGGFIKPNTYSVETFFTRDNRRIGSAYNRAVVDNELEHLRAS